MRAVSMEFRVLGPLRVFRDGMELELGRPRERELLALLLVDAGRPLSIDRLVEALWGDEPPERSRRTLHVYVSRLRAALRDPEGKSPLVTRRPGYVLDVDPAQIDAFQFERLAGEGRTKLRATDPEGALDSLQAALDLWHGPVFADLNNPPSLIGEISRLEVMRLDAIEDRAQAQIALGDHGSVIAELTALVTQHPYRERVWGRLALALHRSGRQHDARRTLREARRVLMTELGVVPSPPLRRVERQIFGDAVGSPPAVGRPLPAPRTRLVGRDSDVHGLKELMATERLVTLTGPGGTGKSRLALEVAHSLADDFPQGVWWGDLTTLEDPEFLPQAVAGALGLETQPDRPVLSALLERLHGQRLLLVLDNFEQVANAANTVGEMLDAAADLHLLVTSRGPLHLRGERRYEVMPLATADPLTTDPRRLRDYPASHLFLQRAEAVNPAFGLTEENAGAVAQILHLVEGLPLGIELAASTLASLPPSQLLEEMRGSGLLDTDTAVIDMPDRHQSLRSAIQVSYNLLDHRHQTAFGRLGAFRGGFDPMAFQAVSPEANDPWEVLGALLDVGLIQADPIETSHRRFQILEPIRRYAAELLATSGQAHQVGCAHAEHYRRLLAEAAPHLARRTARNWVRVLDRERGNLRAALDWAVRSESPNLGLELAIGLSRFWHLHGDLDEGRRWLAQLIGIEGAAPEMLAAAHQAAGDLAYWQGDHQGAIESYQAAAGLYRSLNTENQLAEVLAATALSYHFAGDVTSAEQVETEAQSLLKAADDPMVAARSKLSLAGCRVMSGDLSRGLELLEEVVPVFEQSGDVWKLGDTHGGLARILLALGDIHAARTRAVSALEIFLETGNTPLASLVLNVIAHIELAAGRPADAVSLIAASTRLGDPLPRSFTSAVLGTDLGPAIEEALTPADVEGAWSKGRSMTPDQVLAAAAPDANT